jgi:hypothetical protein
MITIDRLVWIAIVTGQILIVCGIGGNAIEEAKQRKWRKVGDWGLFFGLVESILIAIACFATTNIGIGISMLIIAAICFWLIRIDILH